MKNLLGYISKWHNTTDEKQLDQLEARAGKQEDTILMFFKQNYSKSFTPFEVHRKVCRQAPITSIRRAITNLTKEGKLVKTREQTVERYGISNYRWRFKIETYQGSLL